jgi:serine protease Do
VTPDGPAAKAGFKPGDVVTKVNGRDVTDDQSLSYLVANLQPGARVPFDVIRDGKHLTLTVTLGTRPSAEELAGFAGQGDDDDSMPDEDDQTQQDQATSDSIGISTITLTPAIAREVGVDPATKGVIVTSVDSSSDAGQKLQRGIVIVSANGQPVTTPQALAAQVAAAKRAGRTQVLLYVALPHGQHRFVPVKIKTGK